MNIFDGSGGAHGKLVSSLPQLLAARFSGGTEEGDPVNRHVSQSALPVSWEIDSLCRQAGGNLPYQGLKSFGITSGISMAVRSGHSFSRIDFYTRADLHASRCRKLCSELYLFGSYLAEAARLLWIAHSPRQAPLLSQREQECLRWSASGKTSGEIGMILGISQHTVYFHLKKAASKFNVHGTRHAISRAMELGLIKPM